MPDFVVVATWPFGQTAVKAAASLLQANQSALDAALAGAKPSRTIPRSTRSASPAWATPSARCNWTPASWMAAR